MERLVGELRDSLYVEQDTEDYPLSEED